MTKRTACDSGRRRLGDNGMRIESLAEIRVCRCIAPGGCSRLAQRRELAANAVMHDRAEAKGMTRRFEAPEHPDEPPPPDPFPDTEPPTPPSPPMD